MKSATLIKIEGALSKEEIGGPITEQGTLLLKMLNSVGQYLFFLTDGRQDRARQWLYDEAMYKADRILDAADDDPITTVRHLGFSVGLFIAADPRLVSYAMDKGVTALLFVAPEYQRPEFRPDYRGPVRAWDELTSAIDARRAQRSEDERLGEFVDGRFTE